MTNNDDIGMGKWLDDGSVDISRSLPESKDSGKIPMTAPVLDTQFKLWNHPPGNSCTCGCGGGWSTSEKSLIK